MSIHRNEPFIRGTVKHGDCICLISIFIAVTLVVVELGNGGPVAVVSFGRFLNESGHILLSSSRSEGEEAGCENAENEEWPVPAFHPRLEANKTAAARAASPAPIQPRPRLARSSQ